MADELFSTELPDIQALIKTLDVFNENVNKAVREGINKGADIILAEQKRLAPEKLSEYISKGKLYVTKKGVVGITTGYQSNAFKSDENGSNHGLAGMVYEFGRPGKSPNRTDEKMKQKRKRIPNKETAKRKDWEKAVLTEVEIDKGTIQAQPHIRRGFDNKVSEAVQTVIDYINAEIDKLGE